jgi:hypothetical protein
MVKILLPLGASEDQPHAQSGIQVKLGELPPRFMHSSILA